LFCFLIDPLGWAEIDGQNFAPGFFVWNSEVGKRSLGIETFWFQAVCQNHIVWDAVEVVEFTRKHTGNVGDSLGEMRRIVEQLVAKRDQRKDGFVRVVKKAMTEKLGADAEEVLKVLTQQGITRCAAKKALELAQEQGRFTIFALVDALTRIAGESKFAGERTDSDRQAARLFALAA
jgi:histone H3/H4